MNARELSKNIGSLYKLRPIPWRFDGAGTRLEDIDDSWRLDSVETSPARIRLVNISTGHLAELEADNVIERRSPDFLLLRCQLSLRPTGLGVEPIFRGSPIIPEAAPIGTSKPRLSADEVALLTHIVSEGGTVSQHSESHTEANLNKIRYEHAVESLLEKHFLVRQRNSYHTRLYPRLSLTAIGRQWAIENGIA